MTDSRDAAKPATSAAGAPIFNPLDPAFLRNPYPVYRGLQDQAPVLLTPLGVYVVTRYQDVQQVLRGPGMHHRFEDMARRRVGDKAKTSPAFRSLGQWILTGNPPDHTRIRGLMVKAFSAARVESMRPRVQQLVDDLIDQMIAAADSAAPRADLVGALARPLPVTVICELLGIPREDWPRFTGDSYLPRFLVEPRPLSPSELDAVDSVVSEIGEYLGALCDSRRAAPQDDLISALVQASEGDDGKLTHEELVANLIMLFFAGHETTVNLIGNGMLALLGHPAERDKLIADSSLIPNAIDEMLRYDNSVQLAGVRCNEAAVTLSGVEVPAGSQLIPIIGAANHDPRAFDEPERFDVSRSFANKPVSFGGGIHFCLGAQLARLEASIAVETLLRRLPDLRLAEGYEPAYFPSFVLRGLRSLEIAWS